MMPRRARALLATLASGAVTLGLLQAIADLNFNQIWFSFLTTLLSLLVSVLLGGAPDALA